ncbi:MAG TPA: serine hydrolase domain-containing protein [Bryobacteraceae bacterium]|nr:serine hydrolase domain-containing protein [Bryobacteraceae bacterium]
MATPSPFSVKTAAMLFAAAVAAVCADPPKGPNAARIQAIPARFQQMVDNHELSGAVVLVANKGEVILNKAVGFADLATRRPMRTDTIFQIMSMTKPITAAALTLLVEEGKVILSEPVSRYLPEFADQMVNDNGAQRRPARPLLVKHLVTHSSGMTDPPVEFRQQIQNRMETTLEEAVKIYAKTPAAFDPGARWAYSNAGLATAGRIIEVVSGMPYEKFVEERILKPLGMKDTFYFPDRVDQAKRDRIAMLYRAGDGGLQPAGANVLGGDPKLLRKGAKYPAPEFGLYSTAADIAQFHQMVADGGVYKGVRVLSKSGAELMITMLTGDLVSRFPGVGNGMAFEVVDRLDSNLGLSLQSKGTFGHQGAFGTYAFADRSKNLVGVLMIQLQGRGVLQSEFIFSAMVEAAVD